MNKTTPELYADFISEQADRKSGGSKPRNTNLDQLDEVFVDPNHVWAWLDSLHPETAHTIVSVARDFVVGGLGAAAAQAASKNRDWYNSMDQLRANRSKGAKQAAETRRKNRQQ